MKHIKPFAAAIVAYYVLFSLVNLNLVILKWGIISRCLFAFVLWVHAMNIYSRKNKNDASNTP